jgi:hypothetical protein
VRIRASIALHDAARHPRAFLSGDRGNIRRLAEKLGCSTSDAEAVYRLARRTGFASAYRAVFESPRVPRGVRTMRPLKAPKAYPIGVGAHPVTTAGGRPTLHRGVSRGTRHARASPRRRLACFGCRASAGIAGTRCYDRAAIVSRSPCSLRARSGISTLTAVD